MANNSYWFPAKRYGWGWGFPGTWQGQVTLLGFLALLVAGIFVFPPQDSYLGFMTYVALLSAMLLGVCYLKGEPPRWRWGDKGRSV
ncbi:hypothetical protein OU995_13495 [Roseateles sp. SL47]|jgi:hypothetical protein|uniref:hypothetical protein n=1 Tax=Roseateles sp. SL47 TaxID=2995138 RepID=UPI00226FDF7E|nr:hypothetical protein [Roseateles sp. SL47]WAC75643.1 hypothetical protein OU995_13495 [Roseateles sp. SL47]